MPNEFKGPYSQEWKTRKYTVEAFRKKVEEYFLTRPVIILNNAKKGDGIRPPSIAGLCVFLNISKNTFQRYSYEDGYKEVCEFAHLLIEEDVIANTLAGNYSATAGGRFLTTYGHIDKVESRNENRLIIETRVIGQDSTKIDTAKILDATPIKKSLSKK